MKKMISLILALCFVSLIGTTLSQNNGGSDAANMTVLRQDSGTNLSLMNRSSYTAVIDWGIDAFAIGEAVKFTPPDPDWELRQIWVVGWNGFNETSKSMPAPNNFLIEIRDADLNLLYRMADTQNAYFTYPGPVLRGIDIPALRVTGDFYVVFYDRGAMVIGMEIENATGNSYFFNSLNSQIEPVAFTNSNNETNSVNWLIRAVGK